MLNYPAYEEKKNLIHLNITRSNKKFTQQLKITLRIQNNLLNHQHPSPVSEELY